ncbi:MAG: alpha/beta hydrolase [Pseudomonadota bacterium]
MTDSKDKDMVITSARAPLSRVDVGEVQLAVRHHPGRGTPILFIHGSFDDHQGWDEVIAALPASVANPLIVYDRRGHSASTDTPGQGVLSQDIADAAALIRSLTDGQAHVVGHSYGASIAIGLAATEPELAASLVLYEPPLFGMLEAAPDFAEGRATLKTTMQAAAKHLVAGRLEAGTTLFVEAVAFGPGSWAAFDDRTRACMLANAETWLDQSRDPERLAVDPAGLEHFAGLKTLVGGTASLPAFRLTNELIRKQLSAARERLVDGAGHGGIFSHGSEVAAVIAEHLEESGASGRRAT